MSKKVINVVVGEGKEEKMKQLIKLFTTFFAFRESFSYSKMKSDAKI